MGRNTLAHRGTARNRLALDIALCVCMRVCMHAANMRLHLYIGETRCSLMRRASACAVVTEFQSSPVQAKRRRRHHRVRNLATSCFQMCIFCNDALPENATGRTDAEILAVERCPNMALRVPATIVTGFLGAGKTTLINWLLQGYASHMFEPIPFGHNRGNLSQRLFLKFTVA